jgi:MFS family permease
VVAPDQLQSANGIVMGIRQVTMLGGPLLAGLLFALAGDGSAGMQAAAGLGLAFAFDSASFLVSAWTLSKVPVHAAPAARREPILKAVGAGLAAVWRDVALRSCFIYWAICSCVVGGVIQVAVPVLADQRLHGAAAFGLLVAMNGAGMLAGMAASGVIGKRRLGNLGTTLLAIDLVIGALLLPLGRITATWQGGLIFFAIGLLAGFMQVTIFTWIQQRVPRAMLGRAMSIFMFIFMGLAPLSAAVTGWLMRYATLGGLFAGCGLFLVGAATLAFAFTPIRRLVDTPAGDSA